MKRTNWMFAAMGLSATALLSFGTESAQANVGDEQVRQLQQIEQQILKDKQAEARQNKAREQAFLKERDQQAKKLAELKQQEQAVRAEYQRLKAGVEGGMAQIKALTDKLDERAHHLQDLFSLARQVAGDTQQELSGSLVRAQYPELPAQLDSLRNEQTVLEAEQLDDLRQVLLKDIQASGQVMQFDASVYQQDGSRFSVPVLRVGTFSVRDDNNYLQLLPESGRLKVLTPAEGGLPQSLGQDTFEALVDPSHGQIFQQSANTLSWAERLQQGGYVGITIILLGGIGLFFTAYRVLSLSTIRKRVEAQLAAPDKIDQGNPLGRILAAGQAGSDANELTDKGLADQGFSDKKERVLETQVLESQVLEAQVQEAILREVPTLDRGTNLIKLLATVAPLLGLLGTVTGMIATFQAISLHGTGDPRLMAGGISQALVTTVLGLIVAIPLLFGHSLVSSRVKDLMLVLSQESLALVANALDSSGLDKNRFDKNQPVSEGESNQLDQASRG